MIVFSIMGMLALVANLIMNIVPMADTFMTGVYKGMTFSVALGAMILSIVYASGTLTKL